MFNEICIRPYGLSTKKSPSTKALEAMESAFGKISDGGGTRALTQHATIAVETIKHPRSAFAVKQSGAGINDRTSGKSNATSS